MSLGYWVVGGAVSLSLAVLCCMSSRAEDGPPAGDVARGQSLFELNCVACHGMGGTGGRGPNLRRAHLVHAPDDRALVALINDGLPPEMPAGFFTDEEIADVAAYVRSLGKVAGERATGDARHGRQVFADNGCPSCHIFKGEGVGYGPELTDIGERRSPTYIGETILNPSSHIVQDFLMVRAVTDAGEAVEGIRVNEDNFSIQVKTPEGRYYSLDKARLKSLDRLTDRTPMPAYHGSLPPDHLRDLIAYLETGAAAQ